MTATEVTLQKFDSSLNSLAAGIESVNGFAGLKSGDRVLLKPNLVTWEDGYAFSPFGVLTTGVLLEGVIKLLKESGCSRIAVGEGAHKSPDFGSQTKEAFAGMRYDRLKRRYGVDLLDFNDGAFVKVSIGDAALEFAAPVMEADLVINLPVLKTHNLTKVSLGFKNLKGCLSNKSKRFCHHPEIPLDHFVGLLPEAVRPGLTIIDGIYTLARGPFVIGRAFRSDILVISRDAWGADALGAGLLGYNVPEVDHLAEYALRHDRRPDRSDIKISGAEFEPPLTPLEFDAEWLPDDSGPIAFAKNNIQGWNWPKYDQSICSGCASLNNLALVLIIDAAKRSRFAGYEFISGKLRRARPGFAKTFLMGNCIIKANKENPQITEAVPIKGCPPKTEAVFEAFKAHGIDCDWDAYRRYREAVARRYRENAAFEPGHFVIPEK